MAKTLYEFIGVRKQATRAEIEARCIELGEKYNPSRNPGDLTARVHFSKVEEAYATLSDDRRRAEYDASIAKLRARRNPGLMWVGITGLIILGLAAFWGHSYWSKAEEQRIAAKRAEIAALQKQEMERAQVQREETAKRRLDEAVKLAAARQSDAAMRGSIQSEERQRLDEKMQSDRLNRSKANLQLAVARRVLADLNVLEPTATQVVIKLRYIVSRSGRYGASSWYGWGEKTARQVEAIQATGCAQSYRLAIVDAARGFDGIANHYMNLTYSEMDSYTLDINHFENKIWNSMRECQRLANADIRYFSAMQ